MFPFEHYENGRMHFHFENWQMFLAEREREYPSTIGHQRAELSLIFPRDHRYEIPVHWNPHEGTRFGSLTNNPYTCFCRESNWSVIFEPYPAHIRTSDPDGTPSYKLIVEKGHINPWGEPLSLFSTADNMLDNHAIRYAYFRNQHWLIWNYLPRFMYLPFLTYLPLADRIGINYLNDELRPKIDTTYSIKDLNTKL